MSVERMVLEGRSIANEVRAKHAAIEARIRDRYAERWETSP